MSQFSLTLFVEHESEVVSAKFGGQSSVYQVWAHNLLSDRFIRFTSMYDYSGELAEAEGSIAPKPKLLEYCPGWWAGQVCQL
jgi:hypothetical protein